ncbi:MAG TPA: response regulator [Myxococcales bacterium]|nr:response regulator [Myxococcales bacterium]
MAAVLLVEDDADTREVLRMLLEDEGYSVACANDGQEAVAYLASCQETPCLVLLDLQMPRVGGTAVLRWMSGQPKMAGMPVAVISARPEAKGAEVAAKFREHVISVLQKPFDIDRVLKLLESHCEPEQPAA